MKRDIEIKISNELIIAIYTLGGDKWRDVRIDDECLGDYIEALLWQSVYAHKHRQAEFEARVKSGEIGRKK